jgi:hypothetical protein
MAAGGDEAKRAFEAMMGMRKIDVAAIEAARLRLGVGPGWPYWPLGDIATR